MVVNRPRRATLCYDVRQKEGITPRSSYRESSNKETKRRESVRRRRRPQVLREDADIVPWVSLISGSLL